MCLAQHGNNEVAQHSAIPFNSSSVQQIENICRGHLMSLLVQLRVVGKFAS